MVLPRIAVILGLALISTPLLPARAESPPLASQDGAAAGKDQKDGEKKPAINIKVDPELSKANEAYNAAIKGISKEQSDKLKALEDEYNKSVASDTANQSTSLELKYCADKDEAIKKDIKKYVSELGVLRNQTQSSFRDLKLKHFQKLKTEASFIDQKLLERHYIYGENLMRGLSTQLLQIAYQTGGFNKTDCGKLAEKLDAAFKTASAPLPHDPDAIPAEKMAEIRQSAERGEPNGLLTLGMFQLTGQGVPRNPEAGLALVTKAAEAGYSRAQLILGLSYGTALFGGAIDKEKEKYWLEKAAAQGEKKSEALLKNIDKQPPPENLEDIKTHAEAGDAAAEYTLGTKYGQGMGGVEKNYNEALKWFLLSAGQGHPYAQSDVGILLWNNGRPSEGLGWMTQAAAHGVVNSQYELANVYLSGTYVPRDVDHAAFWYKKAAEAGDARSIDALKKLETASQQ